MFVRNVCCVLFNQQICRFSRKFSKPSYWHNVGSEPLQCLTLGQVLEQTVKKYGERDAVISVHQNKKMNYKDALEQADRLAAGLLKLGLSPGDRLGVWAPNIAEWYITAFAGARGGFIMVCLNPSYTAQEIEYCINKCGIKGIVCGDTFKNQDYYELLASICKELPDSEPGKINSSNIPSLKSVVRISDQNLKGTIRYNDVLEIANDHDEVKKLQSKIKVDDPSHIHFTSGTTGKPKAATVSHFNVVNNSFYIGRRCELDKKHHKICVQVPLFHVFGTVISLSTAVNYGATTVLPAPSFNAHKSLDAIRQERCTIIFGTPTMYVDLVNAQKQRQEKLNAEIALSGGALCSPQLFRNMLQILNLKKVKSVYGLSETTSGVYVSLLDDGEYETTSTVGYLLDHLEAKVIDENGHIVPLGTPGELCIRGYTNMLYYWGNQDKTDEIIKSSKWLHTGDQFVMEENGYGRIVGRIKDMIIRGGENIYPKEIEDFLNTHPDIVEAQVVGLPHERLGEEVCACIRTRNDKQLTIDEIKQFCKGNLTYFKIPSVLKIVDSFPQTASGKIQKLKIVESILAEI